MKNIKDISLYENIPTLENRFTLKLRKYNVAANNRLIPHWHEHIELLYFLSGSCNFTCNGKTFTAKKNDLVIVNSSEIHSFFATEDVEYFCLLIFPDFFSDVKFSDTLLENTVHNDTFTESCFNEMYSEQTADNPGSDMLIKSQAYRLMAHLLRTYTVSRISPREFDAHAAKLKRLNVIFEYISEHYCEKITTSSLAKMCFLSEGHFCRFFKGCMGKSATEYINEYRIEKASVILLGTDESITAVAARVGFDDVNYFSRMFKKIKKITPGEYRRNN